MVNSWSGGFGRPQTPWEKKIFVYWQAAAQSHRPDTLIQRFRQMYLDPGGIYPNDGVREALRAILASDACVYDFKYLLNRTCFILINSWSAQPQHYDAIPSLIKQFEQIPDKPLRSSSDTLRLRSLVCDFLRTPEYEMLQKIAQVWEQRLHPCVIDHQTPIEALVYRYPFTYNQVFFGIATPQNSDPMPHQVIQSMQIDAQRKFKSDLAQYITCRRIGRPAVNPTLLEDAQLDAVLIQLRGKVYNNCTQREFASHFLESCQWVHSYREFKRDLYHYLKEGLPQYGDGRFLNQLNKRLSRIQECYDDAALDSSLVDDTCQDLLYFLVLDRSGYHFTLLDLVTNIGAVATIGLVMKIVLLREQARFWVEQRFADLFKHYASHSVADQSWLINSLEVLNVALTTNTFTEIVVST